MSEEMHNSSIKKSDENLAKIAITKDADRALAEILSKVNTGFDAGRATKQEIASHIILQYAKDCTDQEVHGLRAQFFNPILLMEATLRRAKETGEIPAQLKTLLFEQFAANQILQPIAKRGKKNLKSDIIKDNVLAYEEPK